MSETGGAGTTPIEGDGTLERAIDRAIRRAISVDMPSVQDAVQRLRAQHPNAPIARLAAKIYARAARRGAALGFATGLPASLLFALPSATVDALAMLRLELGAAAKIAMFFEPKFLEEPDAVWELFVPILGASLAAHFLREVGVDADAGVTRGVIRPHLAGNDLKTFQHFVFRAFGKRITQKAVLSKSVPIVGAMVGGGWDYFELKLQGARVTRYFEGRRL